MGSAAATKRALVFAGAGASFAVDRDAYPTTVQFYDRLPTNIQEHPLVTGIVKHLPKKFGEGRPDVEKILWCIGELRDYFNTLNDAHHPASWFIPNNKLPSLVGVSGDTSAYTGIANRAAHVVGQLSNEISAKVYEFYSQTPTLSAVTENWLELFGLFAVKEYWPDIITTNYDLVIEEASVLAGQPIEYGRGRGVISALNEDVWKKQLSESDYIPRSGTGLLTKLHGSVNWLREHGKIVFGGTEFKGDHAYHGVIYPGFKGVPKDEPFTLMHSYLEAAIQRADVLIFIGFAFRDEYINACIERNIGSKVINVIDPGVIHPPASIARNIKHIPLGFSKEALDQLRDAI